MRTLGLITLAVTEGHQVLLVGPGRGLNPSDESFRIIHLNERTGMRRRARQIMTRDPLRAPCVSPRALRLARREIIDFAPDAVVVSEVMSTALARRVIPRACPAIYDAHNVERELFRSHQQNATNFTEWLTYSIDARRVRRAEDYILRNAGAVLAVSEVDAMTLRGMTGDAPVTVVPNSVSQVRQPAEPSSAPPTVLFVGTLHYPPNVVAVAELMRTVMPRVRARVPDARLLVVGREPGPRLRSLVAAEPWASLQANPPSVDPAYRSARCVAVPMRQGSGTNIKVFEAMAFGVPVVATSKAIEGIPIEVGTDVLVEDDPATFADAVAALLLDAELAGSLGRQSRAAFEQKLAWDVVAPTAFRSALNHAMTRFH